MREESRERDLTTIDREVVVPMLHRIAEQAGYEVLQTENADRSTVSREVVTAILHRVEEQELREHTDHESREETKETMTRIRQRTSEELAQRTSEELTRESVTAILHRIRETEQTRRSPGRAVPADEVTVHTLHRISEEVERELSESEHTELDRETVTHILNHVKEQVEKESEVLEAETADHERVDLVITNRERTDRETAKRETVEHIFHELEEQIGEEFHDESRTTIRSEVIRNLLHRTVDMVETTVRSRVRTQTDREQITQIIHRIERQVAEEWQDVEHITPEAPRRTIFTDRYNRAGETAIGERALRYTTAAPAQGEWTAGMQTEPGMAVDRTEGPTVQAIRQLDEELSEIREREEDDSTVIMELKNDLKKAAEEIEGLRTQKEAAEAEKIEEKRDVYHEEKVKDLFDNSLRLERLRKGY